jgi:peptidoglycan/xylan/chitin deacetylase (PgdA/CDA1 family)
MEMDIYKISLISIGVSICIVAVGIFMGLRDGAVETNNIYLSGISLQDEEEVTKKESSNKVEPNENLVVQQTTISVEDQEIAFDLSFDQNRLFFPIQRNPKMEDSVFLTFNEDQLSESEMMYLLRDLKIAGVNGTFFVRGQSLIQNPKLWNLVVSEGHQVSNYTYSKTNIEGITGQELVEEIKKWEIAATAVLGQPYVEEMKKNFPYFRFPSDNMVNNEVYLRMVSQSGYRAVGWQFSTENLFTTENVGTDQEKALAIFSNFSKMAKGGPIVSLKLNAANSMYIREIINSLSNNDIQVRNMTEGFKVGV